MNTCVAPVPSNHRKYFGRRLSVGCSVSYNDKRGCTICGCEPQPKGCKNGAAFESPSGVPMATCTAPPGSRKGCGVSQTMRGCTICGCEPAKCPSVTDICA